MTPAKLAEVLAERLGEIVPPGFRVVADNGTIWYQSEFAVGVSAGTDIQVNLGVERPSAERIRSVSELALGDLQDFVDEMTTNPWPGEHAVPRAHAEIRGSIIVLWYGDAESPALACRPIDIE